MVKRGLSAIVGIGVFLALCFGGLLPFAIGATVIAALAVQEWITAYQHAQKVEAKAGDVKRIPAWLNTVNIVLVCVGVVFPLLTYVVCAYRPTPLSPGIRTLAFLLLVPVVLFSVLMMRASGTGRTLGSARRWYGAVGLVYIGLLMSSLVWLRGLNMYKPAISSNSDVVAWFSGRIQVMPFRWADQGAWLVLFVAACVWMTDTGAYFVGKAFGKHKLAPRLSPGKTIEGSLGGLGAALLTGALFGLWIHLPLRDGLAVGFIAGTMGQVGDLFESGLKREIGLKDFGSIMPGHGGALDRFDSLLFVAPLAFCYLHFLARI
jgi:phosphatidate cytidylyltransferase